MATVIIPTLLKMSTGSYGEGLGRNPIAIGQFPTCLRDSIPHDSVAYYILSFNYAIIHAISPMISFPYIDPIPYTAKFMFDGFRNNKTQQIRR